MTSIDFVSNPFTGGGPRNIYTLSGILNKSGYNSSVRFFNELSYRKGSRVLVEQFGVSVKEPSKILDVLNRTTSVSDNLRFSLLPVFLFQEYIGRVATLYSNNIPDAFVSTFWQSVFPTEYVSRKRKKAHFYFVQADETGFSNNKTYKAMAEKTYKLNIPKLTHSKWVKEHLDVKYGGENEYIGMGINHESFKPRGKNKEATVFTIARKERDKGFDIFVKAMNEVWKGRKDFKVVIAGNQKFVEAMRSDNLIHFPFDNIEWLHDDNELSKWYETSIFVNTGRFEALPMPPLEAMASGSSVVMTNMPGAREYTHDYENALLCPAGDFRSFAEKIDELLSSEDLRSKISRAGIATASKYTWENVASRTVNFLRNHGLEVRQ